MTDPADTLLFNQVKATMYLLDCARDWERVRDDESLHRGVRRYAGERAEAVRAELHP